MAPFEIEEGIQVCSQCGARVCPECGQSHFYIHKAICLKCGITLEDDTKTIQTRNTPKSVRTEIKYNKGKIFLDTHVWESLDGSRTAKSYTLTIKEGKRILERKNYQKFPAVLTRLFAFLYRVDDISLNESRALLVLATAPHDTLRHLLKTIRAVIGISRQVDIDREIILRKIAIVKTLLEFGDKFNTAPYLHTEIPLKVLLKLCEEDNLKE